MSVSQLDPRSAGPVRRRGLAAVLAMLALAVTVLIAPQPASGAPPCPTNGIPFTSQLTNGTVRIGRLAPVTGASATACGVVDGAFQATIPQGNLSFSRLTVRVGPLSVSVQLAPASDFTGPVGLGADGIHITLSGDIVATVKVLVFRCTIGPYRTTLTTDTSGALTGAPFAGSPMTGRLVGNEDAVPAVHASLLRCPLPVAALLNAIAGLPAAPGESSNTFDATLVLSAAGAAALRD